MAQIYDFDTVSVKNGELGNLFDFRVSNVYYLLAPTYYLTFYANYLMPALKLYDGSISGVYDKSVGFTQQRLLPSIVRGLSNQLFANGIDFSTDKENYDFMKNWSRKSKLTKVLKTAFEYSGAGGTSLLKLNRRGKDLFVSAHRIDTFFVDKDASGKILKATIFYDAITNTVKNTEGNTEKNIHYGICEERYFNEDGIPCVKTKVYRSSAILQTESVSRVREASSKGVKWEELPKEIKSYIKENHPGVIVDKEQYLPFKDYLGCMTWCFTNDIPQVPNSSGMFGQPIGDLLQSESLEYDQIKYFGRNEVDLARARALVPEEWWNNDDPNHQEHALNERFYQKVSSVNTDNDKVTPIQFQLRSTDIRNTIENILRNCALKLQVSASTIASFLNEGAGARTATEIVSERTKTDTWTKSQITNIIDDINEFIGYIMRYYNRVGECGIIFKTEDQSPELDKKKANSDVFGAGNMSPRRYVMDTYKNLSQTEQEAEIKYLEDKERELKEQQLANSQSNISLTNEPSIYAQTNKGY